MALQMMLFCFLFLTATVCQVHSNSEGDVLNAWKTTLIDPNNVLQSWDPTLVNPCTWFHITCNGDNAVIRVDLGNAGLSGPLIPQLALLTHLQYFEVFGNKLSGVIPTEFGNLTSLVSLDLYKNNISGVIPSALGNLINLRFLRLQRNMLSGVLPSEIINLVQYGNLQILNVSGNFLAGRVRITNSTGAITTRITQDPKAY